jgi:peptidyl-prolyl cis-trans isomerase B (cyclophilin B)
MATLASLLVAGCGGGGGETSTAAQLPAAGCSQVQEPAAKDVHLSRPTSTLRGPATATVITSCGSFTIALDVARAPKTASSFAYLARQRVYNDTPFHRIVPGFVIQGGDPTATGRGGPGYTVKDIPPSNSLYTKGVVAMAKAETEPRGTAGSQFFVVTADDAGLPPDYAILGVVTKGLPVVEKIGRLGNRATEKPTKKVVVLRMLDTP